MPGAGSYEARAAGGLAGGCDAVADPAGGGGAAVAAGLRSAAGDSGPGHWGGPVAAEQLAMAAAAAGLAGDAAGTGYGSLTWISRCA